MIRAIAVRFPTGKVLIGWGSTVEEAASYAFKAYVMPWCVQPERREVAELRSILAIK